MYYLNELKSRPMVKYYKSYVASVFAVFDLTVISTPECLCWTSSGDQFVSS